MAEDEIARRAAARDPVDLADLKPAGQPDTDQMFVTELLRREGREGQEDDPGPPARPNGVVRLVAVLASAALVLGAGTASMAALSGPRAERVTPTGNAQASIMGAEALRPDLISASVTFPAQPGAGPGDPATAAAPARRPPAEVAADSGPVQPPPVGRTLPAPAGPPLPAPGQQPPGPAGPGPAGSGHNSILSTVGTFYRNVAITPQLAFDLLGPQMRGSGYQDFRNGWADVERVTVDDMRLDGPNAVLVTASLTCSDGTVLRTLQRVLVTPGSEPRITDARLLSASRS